MKTESEAVAWLLAQKGKLLPWGGFSQCVAFIRNYTAFLGYTQPPSVQGAKDLWALDWGSQFTKHATPKPGDIGVLKPSAKNPDGHTNVVVQLVGNTLITMDQNLTNPVLGGTKGSPVDKITWNYPNDRYLGFIRPKFKEDEMPNDGDVDNVYLEFNGRKATDKEKKDYTTKTWSVKDGLYYGKVVPETRNLKKTISELQKALNNANDPEALQLVELIKKVAKK